MMKAEARVVQRGPSRNQKQILRFAQNDMSSWSRLEGEGSVFFAPHEESKDVILSEAQRSEESAFL
jgi:hypothetical protein